MSPGTAEEDKLDFQGTRLVLTRTVGMIRPYRSRTVVAFTFLVLWTGTLIAGPILVRRGIDAGISEGDTGALNVAIALYVVVAIASYWLYRFAIRSLALVGEGFLRDLRTTVFQRLLQQSMSFYDRSQSGVLVSRMTSDVDSLQDLVQIGLLMFVSAGLLILASGATLAFLSWKLLLLCLVTLPFIVAASVKFHRDSNRAYLAVRESIGNTLSSLQEGISGVRIVQAFARESIEAERFAARNQELYRTHMNSVVVAAWYLPIIEFAGAVTTAFALGVGGWMVRDGQLTLGTVAAFILILQSMFGPVQQLSQLFNLVQSGTASLNKIYGLLDEDLEQHDAPSALDLGDDGSIDIDHVSFAYGDGPRVLDDVDLRIAPGERVAFVGPTGAGKSTVAKLVARFYDPTEGAVRVGGVDLRESSAASRRRNITVVPQEGFLFSGTIADNIRFARPEADAAEIRAALDRLGITAIFDQLPDGLDTEVQERGSRLSAGERQLVSLARASLVDPSVLILDEATSSVDPGTEAIVETAMEKLMEGRTVIAIAHRLSTSARCDRVGVVDDGRLVELGSHDDLVAAGGQYADLFAAWTAGLTAAEPTG
ncbi:MAG: ABC transporter ATP-binding protein [Actinomycetota bacterium]